VQPRPTTESVLAAPVLVRTHARLVPRHGSEIFNRDVAQGDPAGNSELPSSVLTDHLDRARAPGPHLPEDPAAHAHGPKRRASPQCAKRYSAHLAHHRSLTVLPVAWPSPMLTTLNYPPSSSLAPESQRCHTHARGSVPIQSKRARRTRSHNSSQGFRAMRSGTKSSKHVVTGVGGRRELHPSPLPYGVARGLAGNLNFTCLRPTT